MRAGTENDETVAEDLFDDVINMEDKFYREGYEAGQLDGRKQIRLEGRAFGIEKGFEKYLEMGKLHGRTTIWSGRLANLHVRSDIQQNEAVPAQGAKYAFSSQHGVRLLSGARLANHVKTAYALTEAESLSVDNSEKAVAEFDDRLKRAEGKVKIVERMSGESNVELLTHLEGHDQYRNQTHKDANIEDAIISRARH